MAGQGRNIVIAMKRKITFLFFVVAILLAGCSGKSSGPSAAETAGQAAKVYYEQLLKGDYGSFVDGRYQPHDMPEGYRQQLITNAKMFVGQQKDAHKGIKSVELTDANADTTRHVANAFLTLTYGDGDKETIVVPMVESGGTWLMR